MSDAQFAIDIAATMGGGGQTLSELDSLSASLMGSGKNADFFVDALAQVSAELMGAKEEAVAANAALADGNAEFARLERAATQAAKALDKAQASGKFTDMQLMVLGDHANAAASDLNTHTAALRGLESAASQADAKEKALTGTLGNLRSLNGHVNKSLGDGTESVEKLRGALSQAGGPLGKFAAGVLAPVDGFNKLSGSMGQSTAAAVVCASVVAALTAALLVGAVALLSWSVGLADSNRNARLTSDAMAAMHPELAALEGTFSSLTRETGMHADELAELSGKLREAKVSAADMPAALRAAALAETALGKGGAADFVADLKAGGVAASKLSAEVSGKLGPIVGKQMLGLSAQGERLKKNFSDIFGSLDIEPILTGLSRLVGLFDANSAAGQTLQFFFGKIFGPVVAGADSAAIAIEAFVLDAMIWGTKGYLAFRPWTPVFEVMGVAIAGAGVAFLATLVPGAVAGLAALLPLVATAAVAAAPFLAVGLAIAGVYLAFKNWDQIVPFVTGVFGSISEMGANIISGLVNSIAGGAGAVMNALGGVVTGAIDKAKSLLGIHSPSTVTGEIADNTIAGMTNNLDAGASDVAAAMGGAVDAGIEAAEKMPEAGMSAIDMLPEAGAQAPAGASSGGASSAPPGMFAGAVFNVYARTVEDAGALKDALIELLEGEAMQAGSNLTPENA